MYTEDVVIRFCSAVIDSSGKKDVTISKWDDLIK